MKTFEVIVGPAGEARLRRQGMTLDNVLGDRRRRDVLSFPRNLILYLALFVSWRSSRGTLCIANWECRSSPQPF